MDTADIVYIPERLQLIAVPRRDIKLYVEKGWISEDTDDAVWEVAKDFYVMYGDITHVIPRGFITDLASIPRIAWWIYPPSNPYSREASIPHDYIYRLDYRNYTKEYADNLFRAILRYSGMPRWKAWLFYQSVSKFGRGGW